MIGGYQALLKFEDVRIVRDMRNSVNRLVNCETANLNKTVSAAMKQVESIQLIDEEIGLENLPDRLREVAKLRVEHQEISLKELGEMVSTGPISKSGMNHRLRKLNELADKIRNVNKLNYKNEILRLRLQISSDIKISSSFSNPSRGIEPLF